MSWYHRHPHLLMEISWDPFTESKHNCGVWTSKSSASRGLFWMSWAWSLKLFVLCLQISCLLFIDSMSWIMNTWNNVYIYIYIIICNHYISNNLTWISTAWTDHSVPLRWNTKTNMPGTIASFTTISSFLAMPFWNLHEIRKLRKPNTFQPSMADMATSKSSHKNTSNSIHPLQLRDRNSIH